MARYQIWDKTSNVITPIGEVLTPGEWINRYPVANVLKTVCAGGELNGAFFGIFSSMVDMYRTQGCDFSNCVEDQDFLDAIEAFEDAMNAPSNEPTTDERIAAALEYQVMSSLPDVEEE
jgi:hypothetical protein